MKTNPVATAYPFKPYDNTEPDFGLTKREYFAALAMQGLATDKDLPLTNACEIAVRIADCLITELNKDQKDE